MFAYFSSFLKKVDETADKFKSTYNNSIEVIGRIKLLSPALFYFEIIRAVTESVKTIIAFWVAGGFFKSAIAGNIAYSQMDPITKAKYLLFLYLVAGLISITVISVFDVFGNFLYGKARIIVAHDIFSRFMSRINSMDYGTRISPKCLEAIDGYDTSNADVSFNLFDYAMSSVGNILGIIFALVLLIKDQYELLPLAVLIVVLFFIARKITDKYFKSESIDLMLMRFKLNTDKNGFCEADYWHSMLGRSQHNFALERIQKIADRLKNDETKNLDNGLKDNIVSETVEFIIGLIGLSILCYILWNREFTFEHVAFIIGSFKSFYSSSSGSYSALISLDEASKDYQKFNDFINSDNLIDESKCHEWKSDIVPLIYLRDVCFSYPDFEKDSKETSETKKKQILKNINLIIHPGITALTGINGCGKTTLMHLLRKDFLSNSGYYFIGDRDINTISRDDLLQKSVFMSFESFNFHGPLDEIVAGTSRDNIDYPRLVKSVKMACLEKFVWDMAQTIDSNNPDDPLEVYRICPLSPWGYVTSLGQYQKIYLASVFYRMLDPNIKIVLLDEPVANCDPKTKATFYKSLKKFNDKLVLVITHDVEYFKRFERVVVLDDGYVVADLNSKAEIKQHIQEIADLLDSAQVDQE